MELKEINTVSPIQQYSKDFFETIARSGVPGKVYAFEQALPETTIRSKAATFGKELGVKFTVVSVPGENNTETFAVGIATKQRKPRVITSPATSPEVA